MRRDMQILKDASFEDFWLCGKPVGSSFPICGCEYFGYFRGLK